MIVTCDQLLNSLEPGKKEILITLAKLFRTHNITGTLIGAFARDLFFYHLHGVEQAPRATADIDICIRLESWDEFHSVSRELTERNFTIPEPDQRPEKHVDVNGQEVDLLPYDFLPMKRKMPC